MGKPPLYPSVRALLMGRARLSTAEFQALLRADRQQEASLKQPDGQARFFSMTDDDYIPERICVNGKAWFTSTKALEQAHRANWQGTDLRIQAFAGRLIMAARARSLPLFAHNAKRSAADQTALFNKGVSRNPGPEAPHVLGGAVDIIHSFYAWELNRKEWLSIGKLGFEVARKLGLKVEWGGDWKFYDPAHWQLADWRRLSYRTAAPPCNLTPSVLARVQFTA